MGGCGGQGGDVAAHQIKRTVFPVDIGFFQLHAAGADGFDFPTVKHQTGFDLILDKIIVKGFFIIGYAHNDTDIKVSDGHSNRIGRLKHHGG